MLTLEFAAALRNLREIMSFDQFVKIIPPYSQWTDTFIPQDQKEVLLNLLLDVLLADRDLREPATRRLLEELGLSWLTKRETITALVTDLKRSTYWNHLGNQDRETLLMWHRLYWQLYALRRFSRVLDAEVVAPKFAKGSPDEALYQLTISDPLDEGVTLERLALVTENLSRLVSALSELHKESDHVNRIAFADSGSAVSLGVLVPPKVAESLFRLFRDAANAIRFWQFEMHDRRNASIRDSLTTIADIRHRERAGDIQPEDAERLVSAVSLSFENLLSQGVRPTIDSEQEEVPSDNKLLAQHGAPKRLLAENKPDAV